MNKINKLFAGFAAVAMLASCSNDEPTPGVTPETPEGDVAYMAITISSPEDARSRSTEDGDYESSWVKDVEAEHKINSVDLYFFEADGTYAELNVGVEPDFGPNGSGNDNVEYIGNTNVVVLKGVRTNEYPEYVITVLNKPEGFTAGATMQETADKLATFANKGAFIMTTSSFVGDVKPDYLQDGELRHDAQYFATKLNKSDFKVSESEAKETKTPVEIYVERLDAKVELTVSEKMQTAFEVGPDGVTYYKLSQTLAGGGNMTDMPNEDYSSDVTLYVKVIGWALNGTAKQSYMSKKLDASWTNDYKFQTAAWAWNNADDWRSFWAQAWTYGIEGDNGSDKLAYITPSSVAGSNLAIEAEKAEPNYTYCYENTNAPKNLFAAVDGGSLKHNGEDAAVKNALTTHVVLHTQVYQKNDDGTFAPAGELVQYRGVLFTGEAYKSMLLNRLKNQNLLTFWVADGEKVDANGNPLNVKGIDASFLATSRSEAAGHKLGEIVVSANTANTTKVYKRVDHAAEGVEGEEGYKPAYTEFVENTAWATELDGALAQVVDKDNVAVGSDESADAFYYIPVEHHALAAEKNAVEGYYGVVRNHWYRMSVESFKKVGHLVFDPETDKTTPIIPEGPEDPFYYVGAKINILSWKVVNQTITDL